jgi:formamidopyrimidine-DNA glycosylase
MTGQFLWLDTPTPPCRHTRVRLHTTKGAELRFVDTRSFGQMWWVPPGTADQEVITGLSRLGPEPLEAGFDTAHLARGLRGSKRAIKSALLDQSLVAGVGNIYADESLFAAGIHPQTPAGDLTPAQLARIRDALVCVLEMSIGAGGTTFSDFRDLKGTNGNYGGMAWVYRRTGQPCRRLKPKQLEALHGALVEVLSTSIGAGGTTFSDFRDLSGTNGNYGHAAWVYRRGGEPCRVCGTPLRRDKLAGRSSHWCPQCQVG